METNDLDHARDYLARAEGDVSMNVVETLMFSVAHALVSIAESLQPFNAYPQRAVFSPTPER